MSKAAQRHFLVRIPSIRIITFAGKSGGKVTAPASKVWDGGSNRADTLTGPREIENITLSNPYDPERHADLVLRLQRQVGVFTTPLFVTPATRNFRPAGKATIYEECVLIGVTPPDVDASSSEAAKFELEFSIGDIR